MPKLCVEKYNAVGLPVTNSGTGINNGGHVVGSFAAHAAVWNGTTIKDLGTLGGTVSGAQAINDAGQIVGYSETSTSTSHATLWDGDTITDLGTLGGLNSTAFSINDIGRIVGVASTADNAAVATLWK